MDEVVRGAIRQIALSGLRGISLLQLWKELALESNNITYGSFQPYPSPLDIYGKVAIWRELISTPFICQYQTNQTPPIDQLVDLNTVVNKLNEGKEGIFHFPIPIYFSFLIIIFLHSIMKRIIWMLWNKKRLGEDKSHHNL